MAHPRGPDKPISSTGISTRLFSTAGVQKKQSNMEIAFSKLQAKITTADLDHMNYTELQQEAEQKLSTANPKYQNILTHDFLQFQGNLNTAIRAFNQFNIDYTNVLANKGYETSMLWHIQYKTFLPALIFRFVRLSNLS